MNPNPNRRTHLPRLAPSSYAAFAMVHWTLTFEQRGTGWLDATFHRRFREFVLHAAARQPLLCPVYCLMPDHIHIIWCGASPRTQQLTAMRFLRRYLNILVRPARLQNQAHDHVLDEAERETGAFETACAYALENPVRAGLCDAPRDWPWTGCVIPGYPVLHPLRQDFWDKFWRIYHKLRSP